MTQADALDKDLYIPLNKLLEEEYMRWTFTCLNMSYYDIIKNNIVLWCLANLKSKWTMLGDGRFGFEDPLDATIFRIQFSI